VSSIGDTLVGRRLGYRRFIFMEHGAGQAYTDRVSLSRHPSYAGGKDREDTVAFLVPNEYAANLWRRAYPDARVEVIGCPKLDTLPARVAGPSPVVAISFHWPAFICPEAGTAFGHYRDALPALGREFTTIGHAHPRADWGKRLQPQYRDAGIEFVEDFDEVCRRADVYVCDNSSTMYEFAATGRPVVVLNSPQFRRDVNHGLRFWEAADVGINVDQPGDLIEAIWEALDDADELKANRENALRIVYAHRSGAADRAARVIEDTLT
jgi:glycosyltransferase involved in cell wall biosynthesis